MCEAALGIHFRYRRHVALLAAVKTAPDYPPMVIRVEANTALAGVV